jgi:hypothetical protein
VDDAPLEMAAAATAPTKEEEGIAGEAGGFGRSRPGGMGCWRVARGGMVIAGKCRWRAVGVVGLSASSCSGAKASSRRKDRVRGE